MRVAGVTTVSKEESICPHPSLYPPDGNENHISFLPDSRFSLHGTIHNTNLAHKFPSNVKTHIPHDSLIFYDSQRSMQRRITWTFSFPIYLSLFYYPNCSIGPQQSHSFMSLKGLCSLELLSHFFSNSLILPLLLHRYPPPGHIS